MTADHVNPERPWPALDRLAEMSRHAGFTLAERLAVQPEWTAEPWLDPRVVPHVSALAGADGLADPGAVVVGRPWQEPDGEWGSTGRVDLATAIDTEGRRTERRGDFSEVYGDWSVLREKVDADAAAHATAPRIDGDVLAALRSAERDPAGLTDSQAVVLAEADGPALEALVALADGLRRDAVGDAVTYVVNRNLNFTNVCYTGCRFCAFAQRRTDADAFTLSLSEVGDRVDEAVAAGATEICMQGGIHPDLPGTAYFDLAREVKRRAPQIHLHAFSPMEVVNGATRTGLSIREFLIALREAGVDSIPGTAAEILDDDVRWVLTKGKLPTATWIEVVTTAHEVGLRSSSTMMYGHVDQPRHWVAHLRALAEIQDRTGGFTEFVALPFVHQSSPIYLAGVARPGPTAARQPRRARAGPADAARAGPQHPDLVGQARRRRHAGDAAGRCQRPRRHPDGGDHQPDGRIAARQQQDPRGARRDRQGHRPAGARTHDDVRAGRPVSDAGAARGDPARHTVGDPLAMGTCWPSGRLAGRTSRGRYVLSTDDPPRKAGVFLLHVIV